MKTFLLNINNIPIVFLQGIEQDDKIYIDAERLAEFLDEHITLGEVEADISQFE